MLLKVFVFTSLSLQFNFRVHTCILIKQYLLLIIIFFKISIFIPSCPWSEVCMKLTFPPHPFAHFLICCHFSNFFQFPKKVRVIDRKSNVILHPVLIACLDCCFILGFTPFLVSFRFVSFHGHFLYLIYLLVKQSVKNELEKSIFFTKIS